MTSNRRSGRPGREGGPGEPGKPGGDGGSGGTGGSGGDGAPRGAGGPGGPGGKGGSGGSGDIAEHWAGTARLFAACTAVCAIIAIVIGIGSLRVADRVDKNTKRVEANGHALAQLEKRDNNTARLLSYRQCNRNNLDRAEVHLRAQLLPPGRARMILKQLGLPPRTAEQYSLATAERRLPILDCSPNLRGAAPKILSAAGQRRYVKDYLAERFNPVTGERR